MISQIPESERDVLKCFNGHKFKIKNGHIVELVLWGIRLTSLPESMGDLTFLKNLLLNGNKLTNFPESIVNLKNLEDLSIINNLLTSLPESIGDLKSLRRLSVSGNRLTSLPESIGDLKSLRHLEITGNRLTSLPESIGGITYLNSFFSMHNQLTSLPESFGNLKSLRWIQLDGNQLTSLPESFGNLGNLTMLDISGNQLSSLPESFRKLKKCYSIDFEENQFKSLVGFPDYFFKRPLDDINLELDLTPKGSTLLWDRRHEELAIYYKKSAKRLVVQYLSDPKSLIKDELERLNHEVGKDELERLVRELGKEEIKALENELPIDDSNKDKNINRYNKITSSSKISHYMVKINTNLNNRTYSVKLSDPKITISQIFSEAISMLKKEKKYSESDNVDTLFRKSQIKNEIDIHYDMFSSEIFNNKIPVHKGDLLEDFYAKNRIIGGKTVSVVELDIFGSRWLIKEIYDC